jgi:hypothetical protein
VEEALVRGTLFLIFLIFHQAGAGGLAKIERA